MSEEEKKEEKLENLKQQFSEYQKKAENGEYFASSVLKVIEIWGDYIELSKTLKDKYEFYKSLYFEISKIINFDFLKEEVNENRKNWYNLISFFALIDIPEDIYLVEQEANKGNYYEWVEKFQQKLLQMLKNDITKMYAFKSQFFSLFRNIEIDYISKYYEKLFKERNEEIKTIKGDFDQKYQTMTETAKKSKELAEQYKKISMRCFKWAFAWFLLCWIAPIGWDIIIKHMFGFEYSLPNDYFGEIFVFLSKLLFKLPSFVLCLVGAKFLYLFVQYETEAREFLMLDSYLEKMPSAHTKDKAELVKQLASHFFPDKKANKVSQGFLQELMLKMMERDR